jgi:hypothetical protein
MPSHEGRFEARSERNDPVVITRSDQTPEGGLIVGVGGGSMTVKLATAIQAGTSVRVETMNMLVFGDVACCNPTEDGFRLDLILRDSRRRPPAIEYTAGPI